MTEPMKVSGLPRGYLSSSIFSQMLVSCERVELPAGSHCSCHWRGMAVSLFWAVPAARFSLLLRWHSSPASSPSLTLAFRLRQLLRVGDVLLAFVTQMSTS